MPRAFYRRKLPHLQRDYKPHFVTFCTHARWILPEEAREVYSLAEIMDAIKGASAHMVNRCLGRKGKVWQTESFDRVLRSSEKLDEKIAYVLDNPVRRGLVSAAGDYPWLWAAGLPRTAIEEPGWRPAGQPRAAVPRQTG